MQNLLIKLMTIDSTTGTEYRLVDHLVKNFKFPGATITTQRVTKKQKNLFVKWGKPKIIFCTHLDTVTPYIAPTKKAGIIYGRGACDAKGQIAVMYETCKQLYQEGQNNFGLLLLADEEKRSTGAKVANKLINGCQSVIVGEPTENKLITAAKGIMTIEVTTLGRSAHSGYPEEGKNAVEELRRFLDKLDKISFPHDDRLGETTYNVSLLKTSSPLNVIPDKAKCKILFRTTFASYPCLWKPIEKIAGKNVQLRIIHSSLPMNFFSVPGFKTGTVAFGSDAPHLSNLGKRLLYGPGSILDAHTKNEQIKVSDLIMAVRSLKKIYYSLTKLDAEHIC